MFCWYRIVYRSLGANVDEIRCRDYAPDVLKKHIRYCNTLPMVQFCKAVPERCVRKLFPGIVWRNGMDLNWPVKR